MKKILEIKNLSVIFGNQKILDSITLDIFEKEIVFMLGPNGAGKTTLLKSILRLISDFEGEILIHGSKNSPEVVARNCAYVPQYSDIDRNFPINVFEMVDLETKGMGDKSKIEQALQTVDAGNLIYKKISSLSGGEFQRVLIARALASEANILLLDEPTNNLDPNVQGEFFSLLKRLRDKKGLSIIVISHDINIVSEIADRVICINRGLGCQGSPSKVLNKEILEQVYGRSLGFYGHH